MGVQYNRTPKPKYTHNRIRKCERINKIHSIRDKNMSGEAKEHFFILKETNKCKKKCTKREGGDMTNQSRSMLQWSGR